MIRARRERSGEAWVRPAHHNRLANDVPFQHVFRSRFHQFAPHIDTSAGIVPSLTASSRPRDDDCKSRSVSSSVAAAKAT